MMHEPAQKTSAPPVATSTPTQPLGFGRVFADTMLYGRYHEGRGWYELGCTPRQNLSLDPAAAVLHYGQALFEGLKAFHGADGKVRIFRLDAHLARMQGGVDRLAMPKLDLPRVREGILELITKTRSAIPRGKNEAMYIRPLIIADEGFLGVRPAKDYIFLVLLSPVGDYYEGGMRPLRIWVEKEHVRAAPGGLGAVKTAANYAASLAAAHRAKENGYDQVLWLDAIERRYLEEVGTMNLFLRIGDEVVTPPLDGGTILAGITRQSSLTLLREWGVRVSERRITMDEVASAAKQGELKEVFGTGTAAVVSPVGELMWGSDRIEVGKETTISDRLRAAITGVQYGTGPDAHGWATVVG
ncbi:MAG: branched-chain amino acid aminotransferase [Polyangiaceae bacterium]